MHIFLALAIDALSAKRRMPTRPLRHLPCCYSRRVASEHNLARGLALERVLVWTLRWSFTGQIMSFAAPRMPPLFLGFGLVYIELR